MQEKVLYGLLKYNSKAIKNYLEKDFEDDWFQDPILYQDYDLMNNENNFFEDNIRNNFGRYKAEERELFHLPKPNFTLRYSLETNFYDRYMYLCLVLPLMKLFDPLVSARVYNHRFCGDGKYLFLNPVNQWEKFEGIVRSEAHDKVVLLTDIQNYFENIRIFELKKDLEKCLRDANTATKTLVETRFIIDRLCECLEMWSYDKERGLPQNRDSSSFLANIYMRSIDEQMISSGFEYYRYMDDIRIVCKDKFQARCALQQLVNILRDKHLSLNGKKTKIVYPGMDEHNKLMSIQLDLKGIDSLLKTKKKANVAVGYDLLKKHCIKLIESNEFEKREFRFCIYRLSKLARCKEYQVPKGYWDKLSGSLINAITECPTSTDHIYEYFASVGLDVKSKNAIVDYLCDSRKSIYEWQNYLLWKLLVVSKANEKALLARARKIFSKDKQIPNKAGAILYLAAFGEYKDRKKVMQSISKTNDSIFVQRHKWIACKGLDWIKDNVQGKKDEIHQCLIGTYRVINSNIKDIVSPPLPTELETILRSVQQYD